MNLQIVAALLEMIFVFVALALLCHQRQRLGNATFYMAFGSIMFFGIMLCATEVYLPLSRDVHIEISQIVISLPLITAFLMTYIVMGVLKAQRLLMGIICSFLLYLYFTTIIKVQCSWMPPGALRDVVMILIEKGAGAVNMQAVTNLSGFFLAPVFFSILSRRIFRTLRIILALILAICAGKIPEVILMMVNRNIQDFLLHDLLALLSAVPLMGIMLSLYLRMLEKNASDGRCGRFDFLFAFFGSYGRLRALEDDLNSWADRYHLVLRHTAEIVVMADEEGFIRDANIAACKTFSARNAAQLADRNLFRMLQHISPEDTDLKSAIQTPIYFNCIVNDGGCKKVLSASLSPIHLKKQLLLVLIARDITEEVTLAREKEELSEQLRHSQRMESLGMLAGGIAHDFNNCIHAIMGHADVAEMLCEGSPEKVSSHLKKIIVIAEKAGKLTSQLLGFARKGKYNVVDINVGNLINECTGLLDPYRTRGVTVSARCESNTLTMKGDLIQIQQVVLNLLINALDATAENEGDRIIEITAGKAGNAPLAFTPPPDHEDVEMDDFLYLAVRDNGSGIDEETAKKIFEPFFTTKPVGSGTGMGLAMVYGTVKHHKGWIQLDSIIGGGTVFCLFLPTVILKKDRNEWF